MQQNVPADRMNQLFFLESGIEPKLSTESAERDGAIKANQMEDDSPSTLPAMTTSGGTEHKFYDGSAQDMSCLFQTPNGETSTHLPSPPDSYPRSTDGSSSSSSASGTISSKGAGKGTSEPTTNDDGTIRVPSGSGYRIMTPFPWRLHEILEEVEKKKLDWIVSWLPDGKGFQVHCQNSFSEVIIPMFFRHSRYKSFQRQLYLYGFRSLETQSMARGAYFHPKFVRGNRALCRDIVRVKTETSSEGKKGRTSTTTKKTKKHSSTSSLVNDSTNQDATNSSSHHELMMMSQQQQHQQQSMMMMPSVSSNPVIIEGPPKVDGWNDRVAATAFSDHLLQYASDIIEIFGYVEGSGVLGAFP
mmetsp:Transcript_19946/g.35073  ORF Transcript_19946/g.35073 Transcript_19946/m.35073 type:complete len:358 (+) Transcript_19946:116-1189(+)